MFDSVIFRDARIKSVGVVHISIYAAVISIIGISYYIGISISRD